MTIPNDEHEDDDCTYCYSMLQITVAFSDRPGLLLRLSPYMPAVFFELVRISSELLAPLALQPFTKTLESPRSLPVSLSSVSNMPQDQ